MIKKNLIIFLLLFFPLYLNAEGLSKAKIFGIAGFACSIVAIGADILADHYHDKYEEATLPKDITEYQDRIVICERTCDISFGLAVANFSLSTIFWLTEKKSDVGLELNYNREKLCIGFKKIL